LFGKHDKVIKELEMNDIVCMFKGWLRVGYLAGAATLTPLSSFAADTLVSPDDPGINYYGRFDFSNPKAPRFNWSGSTIELSITGSTSIGMEFTDGAGYYDVEVDGALQPMPVFADSWSSKKYVLATSLSPVSHVIRIIRRNEPYWAIATLSGFYLSSGGNIMPRAKPKRKMEFCGDSWTAGYYVEDCSDQQAKTNTNKSWARLTSKAFKAQDIILAESGIGLVKSLGGKTCLPGKYPGTFDTLGGTPTPMWNFSTWIPDIVSIFLGINDKSSGAADNEYITAVHSFVNTIRGNYPNVPILFIAQTWMMDEATKTAVAAETTSLGHKGVYFLESKTAVTGCSSHPTMAEDQIIADTVVAKIKRITGWDTTSVSVAIPTSKLGTCQTVRIKVAPIGNQVILISAPQAIAGYPILIIGANGKIANKLQLDLSRECRWNTAQTSEGLYFIGGSETGWRSAVVKR
jgi:hypothetical protein